MPLQVDVLGRFRVVIDGREVPATDWRRERSAALVKLLALSNGHRLHREQAMEALWPEMSPDASAANLRKAIHFARRTLGEHDLIAVSNDVVSLKPDAQLVVDAELFEAEANAALRNAKTDPSACARAAELYAGELLPDDRYVEWTEEPRERLRQLYARVLRAGGLWEQLLAVDATDEEAQRAMMQAALDAGNRGEVIRQFQRLRERLRVDLGVGPGAATIAIYERALGDKAAETVTITDRVRASIAWGIIHLHSGEFAKAEEIAKEARTLALEAGLAREVGEATALFGLVAHMQGRWLELFRVEFTEWIRSSPRFVSTIFDGHLCLAEFCMCGAGGHDEIGKSAREFLAVAERAGSVSGKALANLIIGEASLFSGDLDSAEHSLTESERQHVESGAVAGQVVALQRLAEVALARGQNYRASRMAQKGIRLAESTWLAPHLLIRMQAIAVEAAANEERAAEAISEGDRMIAERNMCQPCSMSFRVASSIALAEAGEIDRAGRRLDEADRLVGMWNGGPWVAGVWEARGVHRRAQGHHDQASALLREAATRFAELGRPRDAERCLARAGVSVEA